MTDQTQLLPGALELLMLRAVSFGPLHGYSVLLRIGRICGNALLIGQGVLCPVLFRFVCQGLLKAIWGTLENNRRAKFYDSPSWVAGISFKKPKAEIGSRQPSLPHFLCNRRKYETSGLVSFTCS